MRVLFYTSTPEWSGSVRAFAAAAAGLTARGWQVVFACPAGSAVEERLPYDRYAVVPLPPGGSAARQAARLRRLIVDHLIEVVFVHTELEQVVAAMAVRSAGRGAIVRRVPPGVIALRTRSGMLAERMAPTGYLGMDDGQGAHPGRARGSIETVHGDVGVSLEALDAVVPSLVGVPGAPGQRLIACVVDRVAAARAALVLRTVALLAPRHPELIVALLGTGAEDPDLRMHAAALGISSVIAPLGERDDQLAVLKTADLAWIVADGDDAAFGFLDPMGMRVPVVAERESLAQRYVLDGSTGILLPQGEPEVTAARLVVLLRDDERRIAMGSAARARVARDFTERAMLDAFERAASVARQSARR